jgi:hypothetical protein
MAFYISRAPRRATDISHNIHDPRPSAGSHLRIGFSAPARGLRREPVARVNLARAITFARPNGRTFDQKDA